MQLTTKGRYVIRAMIDMAIHSVNGPVLVKDISERQGISARYLEQLLLAPKIAGLIRSTRGAHGGFTFTRDPSEITLLDIVQIMEGSISPAECADDPTICPLVDTCVTHDIWVKVKRATDAILESTTLQDLVDQQIKRGASVIVSDCSAANSPHLKTKKNKKEDIWRKRPSKE